MPAQKNQKENKLGSARLNIFFIIVIVLVLFISILLGSGMLGKKAQTLLTATTDRWDYNGGNMLKLVLSNKSDKEICFSSCPYLFQYKSGSDWKEYENVKCPEGEKIVAKICLGPKDSKTMGLNLPTDITNSRIEVPFCRDCQEGTDFRETGRIYSNEFTIK